MSQQAHAARAVLIGVTDTAGRKVLDAVRRAPHFIAATTRRNAERLSHPGRPAAPVEILKRDARARLTAVDG